MSQEGSATVAVLAGGRGSRIGGNKALVRLAGRPLIDFPVQVAVAAGLRVVVVAKRSTLLPALRVPVLFEPEEPVHPLMGVITALSDFPVVIAIPCDMPLLEPADITTLVATRAELATLWPDQPFPAVFRQSTLAGLWQAVRAAQSVRSVQRQYDAPAAIASPRPAAQISVNNQEDLARVERILSSR